jgi:hypothetical protein
MSAIKNIKQLAKHHGWNLAGLQQAIDETGGRIDRLLGCGAIGCTFGGVDPSGKAVLKVTADQGEYELWQMMYEMQHTRHGTVRGVPEVFEAGVVEDIGEKPAYFVLRESVEPLVTGSSMSPGPRTRQYLFGELAADLPKSLPMKDDWLFVNLAELLADGGYEVTDRMFERCAAFDEDLRKLYDLTDVTNLAEHQPSNRKHIWRKSYVAVADSLRSPFDGIGKMVSSVLKETGSTWVTDLHMGNLGWRLQQKPQVLAYDWLTSELRVNGKLV